LEWRGYLGYGPTESSISGKCGTSRAPSIARLQMTFSRSGSVPQIESDTKGVGTKRGDRFRQSDSCRVVYPDSDSNSPNRSSSDRQANVQLQWSDTSECSCTEEDSGISDNTRNCNADQRATPTAGDAKQRPYLKPPRFDRSSAPESFLAQFHNCAVFNKWTEEERLAFLRGSLDGAAAQILWDYSKGKSTPLQSSSQSYSNDSATPCNQNNAESSRRAAADNQEKLCSIFTPTYVASQF